MSNTEILIKQKCFICFMTVINYRAWLYVQ